MLRKMAHVFCILSVIIGATSICFAQATGNIKGTVADSAGALIAGAAVEVVNDNTGEKRTTTSTDDGSFSITNLPVGAYTVTAKASGFSPGSAREVKVSVAFTTEVPIVLTVGG